MEESHSDASSVYHDTDEAVIGPHPRRFVLIDDYDEDGSSHRELALYGLAFASGRCATHLLDGMPHGKWLSAEHVARRLGFDLIWLDPTA
jgi:hypothetical protein